MWREENRKTQRKTLSKNENQQQTQPIYGAGSGNRTLATLVEASALTTVPSLLPTYLKQLTEEHFFFVKQQQELQAGTIVIQPQYWVTKTKTAHV